MPLKLYIKEPEVLYIWLSHKKFIIYVLLIVYMPLFSLLFQEYK
jgi:hypothetical protein